MYFFYIAHIALGRAHKALLSDRGICWILFSERHFYTTQNKHDHKYMKWCIMRRMKTIMHLFSTHAVVNLVNLRAHLSDTLFNLHKNRKGYILFCGLNSHDSQCILQLYNTSYVSFTVISLSHPWLIIIAANQRLETNIFFCLIHKIKEDGHIALRNDFVWNGDWSFYIVRI